MRHRSLAAIGFALLLHLPASALAQSALRLGPTNTTTYVTFGPTSTLGLATFTIETWFNRQGPGVTTSTGSGGIAAFVPLLTKGAAQAEGSNVDANYLLGINTAGNVLAADFEEGPGGPGPLGQNHPVSGVTPIALNTWYHAAATFDGSTLRLYLNGQLEAAQTFAAGVAPRFDSIQHAALGTTLTSTGVASGFFDGTLDEARVWNVARTQAEIRSTLDAQNPADATLVARWGLDEGTGTSVGDSAGTAENGTVTGTNFSWVASAPFDVAPCAGTSVSLLRFDGANDYVTFGSLAKLGLTSFTIETWFRREGVGVGNTTGTGGIGGTGGPAGSLVPLLAKGAPEADGSNVDANYILGINTTGNVLAADFEEGAAPSPSPGLNHPIVGTTAVTDNNWHHAAATYDASTREWRLYLDGGLEASTTLGANVVPRADSVQPAGLATMQRSPSNPGQLGFFAGLLDEARIWNVARSQAEIQADRFSELTTGTGLVARWALGDGAGTTAADSIAPVADGTLTNGPLWIAGGSLFDATGACDDDVFCNGADTCNGAGLRCAIHAGDPCVGGAECNDACNEAADDCAVTAGTSCTPDINPCTLDQCDGAGACGHPAGNAGALCRSGSGDLCDPDEVCDGANTDCPTDVVQSSSTVCNPGSGDLCDPDELCPGTPGDPCPSDTVASAGTLCRAGSGDVCDPDEQCTGVAGAVCPPDVVAPSNTTCRTGSGDVCDPDEQCTGVATDPCPPDLVQPASTVCNPGSGDACDPDEHCPGTAGGPCPADTVESAATVCRPSGGACDVAEHCPGVADQPCPSDGKSTAVCRLAADVCDVPESCDGSNDDCPADLFEPASTICRPATGPCDVAETCTGSSASCPADTGLPDTDGDSVCDAEDNCPADANPGQENGDADALGDACDPCTGGAGATKHKLTLTKLLAPAGDDKLSFKGQATLTTPFVPALDPVANGVRFLVEDAQGTLVVDATVNGGAYDTVSKTGWKVNGSATAWTYKNPGTHPQGITTVGVKSVPSTPGLLKVKAKGKNGSYPVVTENLPLRATLILDPPMAATGQCIESTWPATPPALPSCAILSGGNTAKCK